MDYNAFLQQPAPLLQILAGVLLLFLGRRLFWLFVAIIGFFGGLQFGSQVAAGQSSLIVLLIAIGCALVGALLAVFLQRIAVAIAGGFAGGILAIRLAVALGLASQELQWVAFIVGAILAAVLISFVFDWALIVLSSLTGAYMIVEHAPIPPTLSAAAFVILLVVGILVQAGLHRRSLAAAP